MEETWYKAKGTDIIPVTVVEETDKCVYVKNTVGGLDRFAKRSYYGCYFKTWQEAKNCLLGNAEQAVEHAKSKLQMARSALGQIQALQQKCPPDNTLPPQKY